MSELLEMNEITSAQLTVWNFIQTSHSKTSRFASSWSACFCSHAHAAHAYVLGLICQDQRQAPRVCEVFPSCISPCLGSPRPLIIPTLTLISLSRYLSLTRTHALSLLFFLILPVFLPLSLSVIYLFMFDLFAVLHRLMMVQG